MDKTFYRICVDYLWWYEFTTLQDVFTCIYQNAGKPIVIELKMSRTHEIIHAWKLKG